MKRLRPFLRDGRGAAAAEFAMVLPAALLILLGTFDIGRYFWMLNKLEKAVQAGARYAVATAVVPSGLDAESYVGFTCPDGVLAAGDTICREALGTITCTKATSSVSCTCAVGTCPDDLATVDAAAFDAIVRRMQVIDRGIDANEVQVLYSGSGIGYAGDPREDDAGEPLSEISPLVTVQVGSFSFRSLSLLGAGITLPGFRYTVTLEDGDGAIAY